MTLETLRDDFHTITLEYRSIDVLLHSDNFSIAYWAANKKDKELIESIIHGDAYDVKRYIPPNKQDIKDFIHNQLQNLTPFHRMGIRKLREIGNHLSIKNYFILNKATLIEEIENVTERLKKDSQ